MAIASAVIIDDEPSLRLVVSKVMREAGFEVLATAGDAEEGLEKVAELNPDITLVDLNLPHVNGVELTRRIADSAPHTLILILTGVADGRVADECLGAGAFHYFVKDERITSLGERVREQWDEYRRKFLHHENS
ncbi:response regulator transcription factor [Endothiovibrio diazotrophicus]